MSCALRRPTFNFHRHYRRRCSAPTTRHHIVGSTWTDSVGVPATNGGVGAGGGSAKRGFASMCGVARGSAASPTNRKVTAAATTTTTAAAAFGSLGRWDGTASASASASASALASSSCFSYFPATCRSLTTAADDTDKKQNNAQTLKHDEKSNDETNTTTTTTTNTATDTDVSAAMQTEKETLEFQAETRQLLDIVTHSLYTDKEVFLRELVSNASDALERLRHVQSYGEGMDRDGGPTTTTSKTSSTIIDPDVPLEIRIETDELNGTLTISDTGIGMTKMDMVNHLGTIARSGSKAFVKELAAARERQATAGIGNEKGEGGTNDDATGIGADGLDASRGIIGKFGVGFYSAFMVGDKVEVRSRSAYQSDQHTTPLVWSSTGMGGYDITPLPTNIRQHRGSSITIRLKPDQMEYADETRIESILKRYSNFVPFPIYLNGTRVNTIDAIWSHDPKTISMESYHSFYRYIANAHDDPLHIIHYRADVPIHIHALFFVPSFHTEKYGMGRMESGVSLYSRKILIEHRSKDVLPEWMRFVKGVVDSEDLPLVLSREKSQDTALIRKLRKALTRKFISNLTSMARKETDKYKDEFYKEYSFFLKEGICQDYDFQPQLSKLLYYETSKAMAGELVSLDEYVSRCKPEQTDIYYLCAPTRDLALTSPYMEAFNKIGREVVFVYTAIDDFVMANLEKFEGRNLVSIERSDIDLGDGLGSNKEGKGKDNDDHDARDGKDGTDKDDSYSSTKLTDSEATEFCTWAKSILGPGRIARIQPTNRLTSSPAIITDTESGAMRRMMRLVDTQDGGGSIEGISLPPQRLEINPNHAVVVGLFNMRHSNPILAKVCLEQVYDNALVAAGLLDDGRSMLPRLNDLLLCVVRGGTARSDGGGGAAADHDGGSGGGSSSSSSNTSTESDEGNGDNALRTKEGDGKE